MIRSHFGLTRNPFDSETLTLLPHQQEVFDILRVHAQQGGLCLVLGEPGTGKSVIKHAIINHDPKRMITPVVNRTLHTYHNTLRILCEAFQIEFDGRDCKCERLLVQEAFRLHRTGKMLVPLIDDAHLMQPDCLRNSAPLRGLPQIPQSGSHRTASFDANSRPVHQRGNPLPRHVLSPPAQTLPEAVEQFILDQFDLAGLGHNTFTQDALALVVVPQKDCSEEPETSASPLSSKPSATKPKPSTSSRSTKSSCNPTGEKTMTNQPRNTGPGTISAPHAKPIWPAPSESRTSPSAIAAAATWRSNNTRASSSKHRIGDGRIVTWPAMP
jgi:MSHA biogenesis protein MshM